MYQVLLVYTSFSFIVLAFFPFEVYKSRSIVVAETSLPSRGDVVATFPQSFGLEQVSETSRRRLPPRTHI